MYLFSIFVNIQPISAHMHTWYVPKGMSLPSIPELNGVVPAGAY